MDRGRANGATCYEEAPRLARTGQPAQRGICAGLSGNLCRDGRLEGADLLEASLPCSEVGARRSGWRCPGPQFAPPEKGRFAESLPTSGCAAIDTEVGNRRSESITLTIR
jgi:hypothetical protein